MSRYWKANADVSQKCIAALDEWAAIIKRGCKLAKKCGARDRVLTGSGGFGRMMVYGFVFKDQSKVDKKVFVRLKNSDTGWRPRHNKSELAKEFYELYSDPKSTIADLIGMNQLNGDLSFHTPGILIVGNTAYIETPDYVTAKGCKRISDIEFERVTKATEPS